MPPKPIPHPHLINQYPILTPPLPPNNNDGSKFHTSLSKDISKPVNSFLTMIENNLIIVGGAIIGVVFLILKKK